LQRLSDAPRTTRSRTGRIAETHPLATRSRMTTLLRMAEHIQVRLISLLEEAANSFEQLETLANRTLREIPANKVDHVELRPLERDIMEADNEPGSEIDHVVFIQYRTGESEL